MACFSNSNLTDIQRTQQNSINSFNNPLIPVSSSNWTDLFPQFPLPNSFYSPLSISVSSNFQFPVFSFNLFWVPMIIPGPPTENRFYNGYRTKNLDPVPFFWAGPNGQPTHLPCLARNIQI